MKNIHILPTTQNSWLCLKDGELVNANDGGCMLGYDPPRWLTQHIYITNSEKPKEGDWCYNLALNIVEKATKFDNNVLQEKVILTTDQVLIKDGVQEIDGEFLEWFVKNPSCEQVEVIYGLYNPMGRKVSNEKVSENHSQCVWKYKIIIPKGEPKFVTVNMESVTGGDLGKVSYIPLPDVDHVPKQETKFEIETQAWVDKQSKKYQDWEKRNKNNIPKEESTLANMKCTCMNFHVNCFSGMCRVCGLPQKKEPKLTNVCIKCGVDLYATEGGFECQKHPKECKGIIIPKETLQEWAILEKSNKQFLDKGEFEREMILMNANTTIDTRKSTQEAAERYDGKNAASGVKSFIGDVKYQQEQDKNKYSEEEVLDILREFYKISSKKDFPLTNTIPLWFEQFKKK